jgi:hypothetical protein
MMKQDKLDKGQIEKIVVSLHALGRSHPGLAEILKTEANYFERNQERMRYPEFRKRGFFVGSGVIDAGRKTNRQAQTIGHVPDRPRSQHHHRAPLLSPEREVRGLLGVQTGIPLTLKSYTPEVSPLAFGQAGATIRLV